MPKFNVSVPNPQTRDEAIERLKGFSETIKRKMGDQVSDLEQTWEGEQMTFGFTTFGFRITGVLQAAEEDVTIDGDLPFAAAMFKGKIASAIEEQLTKILS